MSMADVFKKTYRIVTVSLVLMLFISIFNYPTTIAADKLSDWKDELGIYNPVIPKERTLGFNIEVIDGKYIVNYVSPMSPAYYMGLKTNDTILAIDNVAVTDKTIDQVTALLKIPLGDLVELSIERENDIFEVFLISVESEEKGFAWETINNTSVFQITYFDMQTQSKVAKAIERVMEAESKGQIDGIVIDVRNNHSSDYNVAVAIFNDLQVLNSKIKTVVLVNEQTANAGEFLALILQKHNQSYTIGKDTKQIEVDLKLNHGITQKVAAIEWVKNSKEIQIRMSLDESIISIQGHTSTMENPVKLFKEKNTVAVPLGVVMEAIGKHVAILTDSHYVRSVEVDGTYRYIDQYGNMFNEKLQRVTRLEKDNELFYVSLQDLKKHFGFNYTKDGDTIVITYVR